jgi:hypothetical protein
MAALTRSGARKASEIVMFTAAIWRHFAWVLRLCKAAIGFVRPFRCFVSGRKIPFPGNGDPRRQRLVRL